MNALCTLVAAFNKADLLTSLDILWKGLLAVVIVVGLIIIATFVMNAISYKIAKRKEEKENAKENSDKNADQN